MSQHGLGRIYSYDVRDQNYLLKRPAKKSSVRSKIWDVAGPVLDQGQTPMCVGYGTSKWIEAAPIVNPLPDPVAVYNDAQAVDGSPFPHDGTTVRAAMKVLQSKGVVQVYSWAFDLLTVMNYVLEKGPMVVGVNWFDNMFDPDINGNLRVSGKLAGGHCFVLIGADQGHKNRSGSNGAFQILNSWGPSWGLNGRAWISFAGMSKLITEQGEAAVATELLEKTPVQF